MPNFDESKLKKFISSIAKANNFSENINIQLSGGNGKGNGYMSEIVIITVTDEENTKQKLDLIAKISMKDEKLREFAPVGKMFSIEIFAYETVIKALLKLQEDANTPKRFNSVAKFYGAMKNNEEEYLILENLKASGFEMFGLTKTYDHEHASFLFKNYGRFHALSFALKVLHPEKFKHIQREIGSNSWNHILERELRTVIQGTVTSVKDILMAHGYENDFLNIYSENCISIMKKIADYGDDKFICILHGDCWSNNFMFKYKICDGQKKLEEIKYLDWQLCSVGSPVLDLSYSLYSGASKDILDDLETYLKIYHESLSNFLGFFNLDVDSIYPYRELKRQWKEYYHLGVILSTMLWKVKSAKEESIVDTLNYQSTDGSNYLQGLIETTSDEDFVCENVKNLYEHITEISKKDW